jgi:hypothetical protein
MDLSNSEIRVLGCLIEKEATTPDQDTLELTQRQTALLAIVVAGSPDPRGMQPWGGTRFDRRQSQMKMFRT